MEPYQMPPRALGPTKSTWWHRWAHHRKIRALSIAPIGSTRTESDAFGNLDLYEPLGWECVDRQPVHIPTSGWLTAFSFVKRRVSDPSVLDELLQGRPAAYGAQDTRDLETGG
jgi:hypothetical protein